jgi:hypothetical protein
MEKLPAIVVTTAVKTTVATIVLTVTATIAGLTAQFTSAAAQVANFSSGLAFVTAIVATLFTAAVGFAAKADGDT